MAVEPFSVTAYIELFSACSDRYGYPHLLGVMEMFGAQSLMALTVEQCQEYARQHDLLKAG